MGFSGSANLTVSFKLASTDYRRCGNGNCRILSQNFGVRRRTAGNQNAGHSTFTAKTRNHLNRKQLVPAVMDVKSTFF